MVRNTVLRVSKSERGQALIEFAFILPIILVVTLMLVDFSRGIDHRDVLQHAVREGGRMAAVKAAADTAGTHPICTEVHNQSQGLLSDSACSSDRCSSPTSGVPICVCYVEANGTSGIGFGDAVSVRAFYTFKFSAGGGELLDAFGVPVPSIDMKPKVDFAVESTTVSGANVC